jgi:cytoskeletal protein CcmA (bactofilin family)
MSRARSIAEAVEVRGRVVGAITSKQVRLYGTSYIDGDITHEQLAMETGAFFQGRSLKFQRPAPSATGPNADPGGIQREPKPGQAAGGQDTKKRPGSLRGVLLLEA